MILQQRKEIHDYLLTKNLPIDLMMEIEDHIITSIIHQQAEKDISFDDAFNSVIISWHNDLKLFWDGNWTLTDTSQVIKESSKQKLYPVLKKSVLIGLMCTAIFIVLFYLLSFDVFRMILGVVVCLGIIYPFIIYLKEKQYFDLQKKYINLRLSAYQDMVSMFFILPLMFIWIIRFVFENNNEFSDLSFGKGIVFGFLLLFFFIAETAIIIYQQKYIDTLKKLKPYLEQNFRCLN